MQAAYAWVAVSAPCVLATVKWPHTTTRARRWRRCAGCLTALHGAAAFSVLGPMAALMPLHHHLPVQVTRTVESVLDDIKAKYEAAQGLYQAANASADKAKDDLEMLRRSSRSWTRSRSCAGAGSPREQCGFLLALPSRHDPCMRCSLPARLAHLVQGSEADLLRLQFGC